MLNLRGMSTTAPTACSPGTSPSTWLYLERRPDSPYKQLWLKGRTATAMRLYNMYRDPEAPMTAEVIARDFEVPVEAVQEAIAYGQTNPPEVQEDRAMDDARIRRRLHEACHLAMCAAPPRWPWVYLDRKPGSLYKQFYIKDRRISARTLDGRYMSETDPLTVDEIASNYELPLEAVLEALAYCSCEPPEILEDWQRDQPFVEAKASEVAELRARLRDGKPISTE